MPSWSGVGNARPVSTTIIRPSYSRTVMFLPISPNPPRGRTRSVPLKPRSATRDVRERRDRERVHDVHDVLLDRAAVLGLVDDPAHLATHERRGREDPTGAARV